MCWVFLCKIFLFVNGYIFNFLWHFENTEINDWHCSRRQNNNVQKYSAKYEHFFSQKILGGGSGAQFTCKTIKWKKYCFVSNQGLTLIETNPHILLYLTYISVHWCHHSFHWLDWYQEGMVPVLKIFTFCRQRNRN